MDDVISACPGSPGNRRVRKCSSVCAPGEFEPSVLQGLGNPPGWLLATEWPAPGIPTFLRRPLSPFFARASDRPTLVLWSCPSVCRTASAFPPVPLHSRLPRRPLAVFLQQQFALSPRLACLTAGTQLEGVSFRIRRASGCGEARRTPQSTGASRTLAGAAAPGPRTHFQKREWDVRPGRLRAMLEDLGLHGPAQPTFLAPRPGALVLVGATHQVHT